MTTLYSKAHCVQCTATERKLTQLGVEYRVIKVDEDADALNYVVGLGYAAAPVVVAPDGSHWSGYVPANIEALADRIAA